MSTIRVAYQGDDLELREMIELSHRVHEMMEHPGWEAYRNWLYEDIAKIHRRLHDAQFSDVSEYRLWAGKAQGIEQALTAYERIEQIVQSLVLERGLAEPDLESSAPEE